MLDLGMATYAITPRPGQSSFDIAIVGADGARQTMLAFKTEGDAPKGSVSSIGTPVDYQSPDHSLLPLAQRLLFTLSATLLAAVSYS
jgi:hypothetical protein